MVNYIDEENKGKGRRIEYTVIADCWINSSHTKDKEGYGIVSRKGKKLRLHRYVLFMFDPEGYFENAVAMHSCNNKECINPNHLSWGTISQNTRDAYSSGLINLERKLSKQDKINIKKRIHNTSDTFVQIALDYNVSSSTVRNVNLKFDLPCYPPRNKRKTVTVDTLLQVDKMLKANLPPRKISEELHLSKYIVYDYKRGRYANKMKLNVN